MSVSTGEQAIGGWLAELAARRATPGGGAAAAVAAAVGAAVGAMAARYTTGPKWAEHAAEASRLAESLDAAVAALLATADKDAAAYADLQQSWRAQELPAAERAAIESRARAVPAGLLASCAEQAQALARFLPNCNPQIISDAKAAIHLLAGAGRAAYQTLLMNTPDPELLAQAQAALADLDRCEAACR